MIEMGSDAFLRCCSSILQSHPTWNGTVFVTVQSRAYSDASFEVLVHGEYKAGDKIHETDLNFDVFFRRSSSAECD